MHKALLDWVAGWPVAGWLVALVQLGVGWAPSLNYYAARNSFFFEIKKKPAYELALFRIFAVYHMAFLLCEPAAAVVVVSGPLVVFIVYLVTPHHNSRGIVSILYAMREVIGVAIVPNNRRLAAVAV